ncbi:hypothetical protein [Actinoplanes teichomyceticus]|uniref:Uncharacterized protein n=1 Tax=Actinoplanes teichomyceticus TaxID=1867 RepID=A0A561WML4_ACTTI|nr:hypothetical protein [Actinoplanes teichomyceticus]TWG25117.1 hypothetical protein FHX34_10183 [Actinoplanes teichomyceticus]GIF10189.1 hypothetical protein Ate01nite_02210 [Actinoplanes teichomyceticus]
MTASGGTGQAGSPLVGQLRARGSRRPGRPGWTWSAARAGLGAGRADVVVDVLNTREREETAATASFRESARNVARSAGVRAKITSDGRPFLGADIPVDAPVAGPGARLGTVTLAAWRERGGS